MMGRRHCPTDLNQIVQFSFSHLYHHTFLICYWLIEWFRLWRGAKFALCYSSNNWCLPHLQMIEKLIEIDLGGSVGWWGVKYSSLGSAAAVDESSSLISIITIVIINFRKLLLPISPLFVSFSEGIKKNILRRWVRWRNNSCGSCLAVKRTS